jgi:probable HAF family extracellular repeat protein
MQDLGTLGGNFGGAVWINDAGEVVGTATIAGDQATLGFFWKDGKMTNLGTVDGDPCSIAVHINRKEQIVGSSLACGANGGHAFLWENGGPMVDLNTLVAPGSGLQLTRATSINERGEITTFGGLSNGDTRTVLLIPCDENHTNLEGCDYSLVDAPAVAGRNPAPVTQRSTTATPANPAPSAFTNRMLLPFGNRHLYPYHIPGPATGQTN